MATDVVSTDRHPPVVTPTAAPPTSGRAVGGDSTCTDSGSNSVVRRCSCAAAEPRNDRVPDIGPCSVTTPSRAATAWCSAVTSLYPTSTVGSAPRSAAQSTRSIMRCDPYPPRTQTIARTSGVAHAVQKSSARASSSPAR